MTPERLTTVAWLDAARTASRRLADSRAQRPRPALRRMESAHRPEWLRPLLTATAFALAALVLGSGAWAFILRQRAERAQADQRSVVPFATPPAVLAAKLTAKGMEPAAAPNLPPARRLRRARPVRVVVDQAPPREMKLSDDEPYGDVIFGKPPVKLPPLFTTEEYKSRGLLRP